MSKLIRRTIGIKKRGTALIVALQLTFITLLSLVSFIGGPQQSAKAPVGSQTSAPVAGGGLPAEASAKAGDAGTQSAPAQPSTAQAPRAIDKASLRKSAVFAKKLQEPLASQVFNLANSRIAEQAAQRSAQGPESPNEEPTLTTDQEDYPPLSYVYFHGTGFQPGETVNMIVVELDPDQQSFDPWDVVADENGEFDTSWYIFSADFLGATFQATATGESSQLTASATFTDANANGGDGTMTVSRGSVQPNSTGNSFTFSFRNQTGDFNGSSFATVVVPAGWTAPTTSAGQPGSVSATAVGSASITGSITITGTGPWTITVPFNANGGTGGPSNGFNLSYGGTGVTAPSSMGVSTFTTSTQSNNGGGANALAPIDSSASIVVSSTIQQRGIATMASVPTGTPNPNNLTLTINRPAGVVAGDVIIANIQLRGGSSPFPYPNPTPAAGWLEIARRDFQNTGVDHRCILFYKVAGSSEPSS